MCYTLPKIWKGRIKKYWDKTMPADFPVSKSKFALKFATPEETEAVNTFEEQLGTEESVVNNFIPEGSFLSGYLGVYDVTGEVGELTLLSPEKVNTKDDYKVLHLVNGEWVEVQDTQLIDGYIWGTVDSFSPIAVVYYKREMEIVSLDWYANKIAVANGNPVSVTTNEEDGHIIMTNKSSGKVIDLTKEKLANVVGGTADGTDVDNISITVSGVDNNKLNIYVGSFWFEEVGEGESIKSANVGSSKLTVVDSVVRGITGCMGAVRTGELDITVKGSTAYYTAAGQTTIAKKGKDVNISLESLSMASAQWVKKVNYTVEDSTVEWQYTGGNSGYSYTVDSTFNIINSNITGGITSGGSNGRSDNVTLVIDGVVSPTYTSINRGIVDSVNTKITNSEISELAILGNMADDINGKVNMVTLKIGSGKYGIVLGRNDDKVATTAESVNFVKISRSADYTISDSDLAILGDKFSEK